MTGTPVHSDTSPTDNADGTGTANRTGPLRVAIVNDYEIVVKGLQAMLAPFGDRVEVVDVEAGGAPAGSADVVLFDTFAAYRDALLRIDQMAARSDLGKVVLYTWDLPVGFADDLERRNVDAVILKTTTGELLVEALERTAAGDPPTIDDQARSSASTTLTDRELEVLALLAVGASNSEIAEQLYLSVDTVKTHLRKLYGKLGVHNRTKAALRAPEFGLRRHDESSLLDV